TAADPLGVIEDGALVVENGSILDIGPRADVLARHQRVTQVHTVSGVVTPGLVDAHTHAPWVGPRDNEYAARMAGADYDAIAAAGGGIVASMRAVRAAGVEEIAEALAARLGRMASLGVTTVEAKSGYGLDEASERKQLEAVAEVARRGRGPRLVPT